jgi:ArsR family transcriptional regulator
MERFGRGVGNESRARIIEALIDGPKTVSELTALVGLSQSAVSQHLSKLKTCGLVSDTRRGQEVVYTFNSRHVLGMFAALLHRIHRPNARQRGL